MNRNTRMKWKLAGIIAGMAVLFVIVLSGIKSAVKVTEQVPGISEREASLLTQVFITEAAKSSDSDEAVKAAQELMAQVQHKSTTKHPVTREGFFSTYWNLVTQYSLQQVLYPKKLMPLAEKEGQLLCREGKYSIEKTKL